MDETLQRVKVHLDRKLHKNAGDSFGMLHVVQQISGEGFIPDILDSLLRHEEDLISVAANSYTHNNGFDKITLLSSSKPSYKLRLHIWWPGSTYMNEHIHNHSWDFSSAILTGAFRFQLFENSHHGLLLHKYLCAFPDEGVGYKMTYLGKFYLKCIFDSQFSKGNAYTLSHHVFHKIVNQEDQTTSTIILHGEFINDTSFLFSEKLIQQPHNIESVPFSPEKLYSKIKDYLKHLDDKA
ncbi:MAG: hypothetical protein JWP81_4455 [Ferruginibacter sp.]|nr:hypothetical protein [Ferruginibacter sp.]